MERTKGLTLLLHDVERVLALAEERKAQRDSLGVPLEPDFEAAVATVKAEVEAVRRLP